MFGSFGPERVGAPGTSVYNDTEADAVQDFVKLLLVSGVPAGDIGVISPYRAQKDLLRARIATIPRMDDTSSVEVESVDSFQGREKEYIVVSMVRSNRRFISGFLKDPRRLNVALTRARRGLIVIANSTLLGHKPGLLCDFVIHASQQGCYMEGPVQARYVCQSSPELARARQSWPELARASQSSPELARARQS
jgi:regulator of nonsense transcripts 1